MDVAEWGLWWAARPERDAVEQSARGQGFVLFTDELSALGISRATIRHRIATKGWSSAAHGVVAPFDLSADEPDEWTLNRRIHAVSTAAATRRRPGHVGSGRSAAVLHGLPTQRVPDRAELTDPEPDGLGRRAGAHLFGATLPRSEITQWFGIPVTCPARTVVDLARHSRRDGIMAADAALRAGLVTLAECERALETARGWPGVRQARVVVALADPRSESPLESVVRLLMNEDGLPVPELQVRIGGYRVDLALPGSRLVVEADGRVKYRDDELWREKVREQQLRRLGWQVERVLWSDVTRAAWPATSTRLRNALQGPASRLKWSS